MFDRLFFVRSKSNVRAASVFKEVPEPPLKCEVSRGLAMAAWLGGLGAVTGDLDISASPFVFAFHTAPYEDVLEWFEARDLPVVHVSDVLSKLAIYEIVDAKGRAVKDVRWRSVQAEFDVAFHSVADPSFTPRPNIVCVRCDDAQVAVGGRLLPARVLETSEGLITLPDPKPGVHRLSVPLHTQAESMREAVGAPAAQLRSYLAEHGVDARDEDGRTCLMHAAVAGKLRPLKLILAEGADASCEDKSGRTALGLAAQQNAPKTVVELLKAETPLKGRSGRRTLWDAFEDRGRLGEFDPLWERYRASTVERAELEDRPSPIPDCVDPLGAPIMNRGRFTQCGWIPEGHAEDGLDMGAVEAARALSQRLAELLEGCSPIESEGSATFTPFYIPCLGRDIRPDDLAVATQESLTAASGAYKQCVDVRKDWSTIRTLFPWMLSPEVVASMDTEQRRRFFAANQLAAPSLSACSVIDVYPDFVTFPTIFGGLDEHFSFVGVITQRVWT